MARGMKLERIEPFNPLDKEHLAASVAGNMMQQEPCPLPPAAFVGAGVYAIYYTGNLPIYEKLAQANRDNKFRQPIYVGKAIPAGARKGNVGLGEDQGTVLCHRLLEHANSIRACANMDIRDFFCRYIVVDDIWIPLAESMMINRYKPLWNQVLDGFGNHDPGNGRYKQQRSPWDVLHPGRAWADKLQAGLHTRKALEQEVVRYLESLLG